MASAAEIVSFWRDAGYQRWFARDDSFDADFKSRFLDDHFSAARRERDDWNETAEGALALLVLLDQFPRNCFRGTAHMFATDPLARHFARQSLKAGHDRTVDEPLRLFFYLPFMHSEDLADQNISVELCEKLSAEIQKFALEHREIIERFGRFPHRNATRGHITTAAERAYLDQGGFSG